MRGVGVSASVAAGVREAGVKGTVVGLAGAEPGPVDGGTDSACDAGGPGPPQAASRKEPDAIRTSNVDAVRMATL